MFLLSFIFLLVHYSLPWHCCLANPSAGSNGILFFLCDWSISPSPLRIFFQAIWLQTLWFGDSWKTPSVYAVLDWLLYSMLLLFWNRLHDRFSLECVSSLVAAEDLLIAVAAITQKRKTKKSETSSWSDSWMCISREWWSWSHHSRLLLILEAMSNK